MSLIPSESYSFPDHFTNTVTGSRKPKDQEPEEPPKKKPAIVALPNPKPRPAMVSKQTRELAPAPSPTPAPVPAPAPSPALRRANAPPPRIPEPPVRKIALPPSLKPKVRWNNRAPAMDPTPMIDNGTEQQPPVIPSAPAQNVIPMKPARTVVPRPPRMMPPPEIPVVQKSPMAPSLPKPAPVAKSAPPAPVQRAVENAPAVSIPEADFFEMFAQSGETALGKRRRKAKLRRFVVCESIAVGVLLPLALLGLTHRPESAALLWILNISTIASAVAAALIPILFYAFTPTLPEIER